MENKTLLSTEHTPVDIFCKCKICGGDAPISPNTFHPYYWVKFCGGTTIYDAIPLCKDCAKDPVGAMMDNDFRPSLIQHIDEDRRDDRSAEEPAVKRYQYNNIYVSRMSNDEKKEQKRIYWEKVDKLMCDVKIHRAPAPIHNFFHRHSEEIIRRGATNLKEFAEVFSDTDVLRFSGVGLRKYFQIKCFLSYEGYELKECNPLLLADKYKGDHLFNEKYKETGKAPLTIDDFDINERNVLRVTEYKKKGAKNGK